ncbi:hypothetical protein FHT85_005288 [Rhizobium sp. BK312]|jgi:hypothetical protein|nr:hypothetical protein [Rhizobium sp. BK312]
MAPSCSAQLLITDILATFIPGRTLKTQKFERL